MTTSTIESLSIRRVKPHEIPLHLLRQKKIWNLSVFYEMAVVATDWWAFVIDDGEASDPWAAVIITDNHLYDSVACQTLIVDKARRTPDRVALAIRIAYELGVAVAKQLGRKAIGTAVMKPETFLDALQDVDGIEVAETILKKEI